MCKYFKKRDWNLEILYSIARDEHQQQKKILPILCLERKTLAGNESDCIF
jgi:hypothetical protein